MVYNDSRPIMLTRNSPCFHGKKSVVKDQMPNLFRTSAVNCPPRLLVFLLPHFPSEPTFSDHGLRPCTTLENTHRLCLRTMLKQSVQRPSPGPARSGCWRSVAPTPHRANHHHPPPCRTQCMPPVRAQMDEDDAPSASGLHRLKNQLLRSPGPSSLPPVHQWLPRSVSGRTRELLRGRRAALHGLIKPAFIVALPAYLLATVSAVSGG